MGELGRRALEELCLCQACRAEAKGVSIRAGRQVMGTGRARAEATAEQEAGPGRE